MQRGGLAGFAVACVANAGCSIHPLPENVAPLNTYQIVQQIRCEVADAARDALEVEEAAQFDVLTVAYAFNFDMSEDNDFSGEMNLRDPFGGGLFSFKLNAGSDKRRSNIRNFALTDQFGGDEPAARPSPSCDREPPSVDWSYPITGRIGASEIIQTFVRLAADAPLANDKNVPELRETLTFRTYRMGGAAPKVTLDPRGTSFRLADASLSGTAKRTDEHRLSLVLTITRKRPPGLRKAVTLPDGRTSRRQTEPSASATKGDALRVDALRRVIEVDRLRASESLLQQIDKRLEEEVGSE